MSTSGTYTYTSNRDFIITEALRKIGALGDYEDLDPVRTTVAINALNPMLKAFHGMGMPLWATTEKVIPFSYWASTSSVEIGPSATINQADKPLKILQALRRDTDVDVPITIDTWTDYNILTTKTATGAPIRLFYRPERITGTIYLWPRPDTYWQTKNLYIRYQRPFQDMNIAGEEPDFPIEWHEAIIFNLATRLAPVYGLPPNDYQLLKGQASEMLKIALDFDQEEGSLFVQPRKR